jgi:hypothetical protein
MAGTSILKKNWICLAIACLIQIVLNAHLKTIKTLLSIMMSLSKNTELLTFTCNEDKYIYIYISCSQLQSDAKGLGISILSDLAI